MITCPKCGTENPDGFRNCRECYYPFGLEGVLPGPAQAVPPPQGPYGQVPPPQGPYGQVPPPGGGDPLGQGPIRVISVHPIRRVHPAIWVVAGIGVVVIIFVVAWFLTHGGGGGNAGLEKTLRAMEDQSGWKAEIRVDSSEFSLDPIGYYLGSVWTGEIVYEGPGRFGLNANANGGYSYSLRIIDDHFYEWESYTRQWKDLGEATQEQRSYNPSWNSIFTDELSIKESDELETVEGRVCRVYSFDEEITVKEDSIMGEVEIPYVYTGKIYVDTSNDLLLMLDYSVEMSGMGRTHYRYSFGSYGEPTSVEVPPGVVMPSSTGGS